jgi:hypothetical protein
MSVQVQPTHTCFDDAMDLLDAFATQRPDIIDDLRLVHGICLDPAGEPFSHAWLEDTATAQVLFVGIVNGERMNLAGDRADYYQEARVQETTTYTLHEALAENTRSHHFGPWEPRYRALCRPRGSREASL